MRERIKGLTDAIRQVLEVDRSLDLNEIYSEIERRKHLTHSQQEITYRHKNYQHSVRSRLSRLVKRREAIRVSKGKYRKARIYPSKK